MTDTNKVLVENLGGSLETRMQFLTSLEADFLSGRWTFSGKDISVGAGEYLVIHRQDWKKFWQEALNSCTDNGPEGR